MRIFFRGLFGDDLEDKSISKKSKSKHSAEESRPDWITELRKAVPDLVIWGHEDVLKQLGELRYLPNKPGAETVDILLAFEKLMMEMRKDLGHEDFRLKDGDLLKLFINDMDIHLNDDGSPIKGEVTSATSNISTNH